VPAGLEQRVLAAVQREPTAAVQREPTVALQREPTAAVREHATLRGRRWVPQRLFPRLAVIGAVTAAIAVILAAGDGLRTHDERSHLAANHDHGGKDGDALPIQLAASGGGGPRAHALVARTDGGAVVTFHSDHLPPPGKDRYYELWLVRPGDSPSRPDRISAGRFIPDAKGTTFIDLAARVKAEAFGIIAITRERDDGDRTPSGPDVVRSDWSKRCGGEGQAGCR